MPSDREGELDNHGIAANEGELPDGVIERAKGGMRDRGGQAGPGVGGSGVHGMQDEDNRSGRDEAGKKKR